MTERERALLELQELMFAAHEAALYLDAYPNHTVALRYQKEMAEKYMEKRDAFQKMWGSLTAMETPMVAPDATTWQWVLTPWPWEVAYPDGSDNPRDNASMQEVK